MRRGRGPLAGSCFDSSDGDGTTWRSRSSSRDGGEGWDHKADGRWELEEIEICLKHDGRWMGGGADGGGGDGEEVRVAEP